MRAHCEIARLNLCMPTVAAIRESHPAILLEQAHSNDIGNSSQGSLHESRSTAASLARLTGGRCLSMSFRLAPQHAFPAAILDALIVYLSILYAPPSSAHEPIPAASIVLCGDSAGAAICFAVIQVIIQAQRSSRNPSPQILFHGE